MIAILFLACTVDAPEDFDSLNSFLYQHFHEHRNYPRAGLENVIAWLPSHLDDLKDGYKVQNLSEEAIQTVSEEIPEELIGVAAAMEISYSVDDIAFVQLGIDPEELDPDSDGYNQRQYLEDKDCFLSHECETLSYTADVLTHLPLSVSVTSHIYSEIRWVETELGEAYIQRRWQVETPEVNVDWVSVNAEFGVIITFPNGADSSTRIESTWIDMRFGDMPINEELAAQLGISALQDSIALTEEYLENNPR